jgi:hypothetical protein
LNDSRAEETQIARLMAGDLELADSELGARLGCHGDCRADFARGKRRSLEPLDAKRDLARFGACAKKNCSNERSGSR